MDLVSPFLSIAVKDFLSATKSPGPFLFYSMSLLLKFLKYIFFYYAGPSKPIPTKEDIEIGNGGDVDNGKSSQGTASRSLRDRDVKKSGQGKTSNLRMYI